MEEAPDIAPAAIGLPSARREVDPTRRLLGRWLIAQAALVVVFSRPLAGLGRLALQSDLYSHIALIPVVTACLVYTSRDRLPRLSARRPAETAILVFLCLAGLAAFAVAIGFEATLPHPDFLGLSAMGFLMSSLALAGMSFGVRRLRALAFPLGFMVFIVPMPEWLQMAVEKGLQHGSADVAESLFTLSGMPMWREKLTFQLPGIALEVAPECSGIRSTLALFITSIVAGYLFLDSHWKRIFLAAAVLPLALIRNGFRVFTIGSLCVHVSPDMIHSYIHQHGGPIFFVLSLIPFSGLLIVLARGERPKPNRAGSTS